MSVEEDLIRRHIPAFLVSLRFVLALGLMVCVAFPAAVYGIGHLFFEHQAEGSLVDTNGKIIGSELPAQPFTDAGYFWPCPSAAGSGYTGTGYDATASGGRMRGAGPDRLLADCLPVPKTDDNGEPVVDRTVIRSTRPIRTARRCATRTPCPSGSRRTGRPTGSLANARVPVDAVTASFSGLDPDISVANAHPGPSCRNGTSVSRRRVLRLVDEHTNATSAGDHRRGRRERGGAGPRARRDEPMSAKADAR